MRRFDCDSILLLGWEVRLEMRFSVRVPSQRGIFLLFGPLSGYLEQQRKIAPSARKYQLFFSFRTSNMLSIIFCRPRRGEATGEQVPCHFFGEQDGDVHLFWDCPFFRTWLFQGGRGK